MRNLHALIIATGLCVPSVALAAPSSSEPQRAVAVAASSTEQAREVTAPQSAKQSDRDRYAAKEASSGEAKDYRGGDTLVIGASAATAILAVLLLVVLL